MNADSNDDPVGGTARWAEVEELFRQAIAECEMEADEWGTGTDACFAARACGWRIDEFFKGVISSRPFNG